MLRRIRELASRNESFAFETTLASRTFAPFLREQVDRGYQVHLVYVWISSPDLAVSRVAHRVTEGGHNVPEETVRRRYTRGLVNFFNLYRPLVSSWLLCDNSKTEPVSVALGEADHEPEIFNPTCMHRIETMANVK